MTDFEKEITNALQHFESGETSLEEYRHRIKQAVDKYIIGEDVRTFYEPEDGNASEDDRLINDKLAEQRQKLKGDS